MTREEYKEHLCDIIAMVFRAENAVTKNDPTIQKRLKARKITAQEYLELIADEILSKTPDELIPDELF